MPRRDPNSWSPSDDARRTVTLLPGHESRTEGHITVVTQGTVRIDDADLPYIVEVTLRIVGNRVDCERLAAVRRTDDEPIGSEKLRTLSVPVLIRIAAGKLWRQDLVEESPTLTAYLEARRGAALTQPTRSRRDPELFERFVELVRRCKLQGDHYLPVVLNELHIPHRTAVRWKRQAELEGLL